MRFPRHFGFEWGVRRGGAVVFPFALLMAKTVIQYLAGVAPPRVCKIFILPPPSTAHKNQFGSLTFLLLETISSSQQHFYRCFQVFCVPSLVSTALRFFYYIHMPPFSYYGAQGRVPIRVLTSLVSAWRRTHRVAQAAWHSPFHHRTLASCCVPSAAGNLVARAGLKLKKH